MAGPEIIPEKSGRSYTDADMIGLSPRDCPGVEDAHAGMEAAAAGGFDCAAIGDAKKDKRARWHLERFGDLLRAVTD